MAIVYKSFPVGPLQCNCTVIGNTDSGLGYVIDPGGDAEIILETVRSMKLDIQGIFHTHAHFDHFLAAADIKDATQASIFPHKSDRFLWDTLEQQCQFFNIAYKPTPPPDFNIEDEQDLEHCDGTCSSSMLKSGGGVGLYAILKN
jgi:glyoxylase-like metal-dependent hydrolase (beta-lactamase superfamily II)